MKVVFSAIVATLISVALIMLFELLNVGVGFLFGYILFTSLVALFVCFKNLRDSKLLALFIPVILVNILFVLLYVSGTTLVV